MARTEAEQQGDADARRDAYRAVALAGFAVLCMVAPRVLAAVFFEYDQYPPPILTRDLAAWLALCTLALVAGFGARRLVWDNAESSAVALIAATVLLAFLWGVAEAVFLAATCCVGPLFPRDVRVTPGLAVEVAGMTLLLTAVAGAWLLLAMFALGGWIVAPTGLWDEYARHPGIELILFPLAALAGFASRRRIAARPPWLPLAAAVLFAAAVSILAWSWRSPAAPLWLERWPGAALVAGGGYSGAILYPRLTATLAGGIGVPTLLVGLPVLAAKSQTGYSSLDDSGGEWWWIKAGVACALLALSLAATWFPRWPRLLTHAGWSGAIILLFLDALGPGS